MSAEVPAPAATPVVELTYTEASRELDSIVEFFERQEVDVDQLVARLERATAIVDELDRRIRRTRAQVEELVPRLEAAARGQGSSGGDDVVDESDEALDDGSDEDDDAIDDDADDPSMF